MRYIIKADIFIKGEVKDTDYTNIVAAGLVRASDDQIFLRNDQGDTAVDSAAKFFGSKDQLFLAVPVVAEDVSVGAWMFYHDAITPEYERAVPAYVYNKTINERPDVTSAEWSMPKKDELALIYATDQYLWMRDNTVVRALKREASGFVFAKADVAAASSLAGAAEREVAFWIKDGGLDVYRVEDGRIKIAKKRAPPVDVKPEVALRVLPFAAVDVVVMSGDGSGFMSAKNKNQWFRFRSPLAEAEKLGAIVSARVFAEESLVVFEKAVLKYRLIKEESGEKTDPAAIDKELAEILDASCGSCHTASAIAGSTAKPEDFPNDYPTVKSKFDHRASDHWLHLVKTEKAKGAKKIVLDSMCVRAPNSTCKISEETQTNREKIEAYIDGI